MPFISVEHRPDGSVAYSGYLIQLWQIVAEELGLRYRMVTPPTDGYGSLSSNGTWTGVVGDLAYGRADLALNMLTVTPGRVSVVDFLDRTPLASETLAFMVRRDTAVTLRLSPVMFAGLLRPLGADVWWTLAATLLAFSLVLRLTLRFNSARVEDGRQVRNMGWGSCLVAAATIILRQGWDRTPKSLAGRTVTAVGWVMGVLIYSTYTANLVSILTEPRVDRPISSVKEFVQQPDWTLAMYTGVHKLNELRNSSDPDERELYRRSVTGDRFVALDTVAKGVLQTMEPRLMAFADFKALYHFLAMFASLLRPLGADVWWTLAAALLALSLVLRLSLRFNSVRAEDGRLLYARAGSGHLQSLVGRTATIFGWMMGILIYINYTANLDVIPG
ncbi:Glutamate receptor 2 [Amphibalanus amphitrite]|uniref:Glutamate receptor 2 n=1 Tax=Amphibalanus amphitrite TaxID=1232801 RepID=A0A6A4VGS1_AMPAM|nr:Glutamate receptor 2 [Amphibalanus amphitrite]